MPPPTREGRPGGDSETASQTSPTPADQVTSECTCIPGQLRARRAASHRLPPLACGRRDPWWHERPGERGYRDAAHHLAAHGLCPAPNVAALRDMWKAGGESRRVAAVISDRWLA